jgi:putative MATE family efflux protein
VRLADRGLRLAALKLAWPASLEFLIITGAVFADIILLSRLGSEVIAGVGISVTVFRVFFEVFNAVAVAATTVVAQAIGAGNRELARDGAGQSVLLALALGFVSGAIGIAAAGRVMDLMGSAGLVKSSGVTYMQLNLAAAPLYAVSLAGGGALKGAGDTRTPMLFTLTATLFKIGLGIPLIFGHLGLPALGVAGAGLATICAYALNATLILTKLGRGFGGVRVGMGAFAPDGGLLRRIVLLAWPVAVERVVMRMGFVFYMRMVAALGTVALAANQIALRLESVFLTVGFGFTIAATTLVGQAVGRRDYEGAEARVGATVQFAVAVMGATTVLLILIRHLAVGIFVPEPAVRDLALTCLIIGAFELPALGITFTYAGALRGAGDTRSPMLIAFIGTFALRLPLVYLLGIRFGLGLAGIWYGTLLDWIGRAILIYLIFHRGGWRRRVFVGREEIIRADGGIPPVSKGGRP